MTGILTETANLTNSYQYDSYGNLTSGTADGVNYYGYNGESTNVKTGLQYLRARYYNAENGTFTTEDSDLGTTENPLTKNRYDYTTNNPLNYSDPTGHSLWGRIKSAAKKAEKTVTKAAKSVAKTVVSGVKAAAKWVQNAVSHPKQVIQQAKNTVKQKAKQTSQKIVSSGTNLVRAVSKGGVKGGLSYIGSGAVLGGISSAVSGEGFISGAADGFLRGTIGGAVSGGVGAATGSLASSSASSIVKNPLAKSALENAADTTVGTVDDLAHGRDVSLGTVAKDFGTGMLFSGKGIADDWKKTTKESNFIKNVESNVSENNQMPMNLQFFANKKSPKEIGAVGEDELKKFGGASQVHFDTTKGKRIVDQFVDGTAYESKVGYTSKTKRVANQIEKDKELMDVGRIDSVEWHFFESPVTGKSGASGPLKEKLKENGIKYVEH